MSSLRSLLAAASLVGLASVSAQAQSIFITEVAPWSSGNSSLAKDWFELTNTGTSAVTITGWKMDDNSNAFASSVALSGITSIAAGESVIFVESASDASAAFRSLWSAPASLQVGYYSGSGVGLSTTVDAVNIFKSDGTLVTRVDFGASPTASPFATFDNSALGNNINLTILSVVGVKGAYSVTDGAVSLIGSPGVIPEPSTYAMIFGAVALVGAVVSRRRSRVA